MSDFSSSVGFLYDETRQGACACCPGDTVIWVAFWASHCPLKVTEVIVSFYVESWKHRLVFVAFCFNAVPAHLDSSESLSCVSVFHNLENVSIWFTHTKKWTYTWSFNLNKGILIFISFPHRSVSHASSISKRFHCTSWSVLHHIKSFSFRSCSNCNTYIFCWDPFIKIVFSILSVNAAC